MKIRMKILNLYAGIGGNRKLWGDEHDITAVEYKEDIAKVYAHFFPKDKIIITDAHQFLLDHHREYDFIWSSPPCPTHSDIRRAGVHRGQYKELYPDMALYQEIILLRHFHERGAKFVIENVRPYYEPLIAPDVILHRHYFWANFPIRKFETVEDRKHQDITPGSVIYGFDLREHEVNDKRKLLRNMVDPTVGLHILNEAMNIPLTVSMPLFTPTGL